MAIPVKKFWTKPDDLPVNLKEFTFGYTDQKGKEFEYKVKPRGSDIESLHKVAFIITRCRQKKILPWPVLGILKNKVEIIDPKAEAVQMELPLKVARNFLAT